MAVNMLPLVLETLTPYERAIFEARSEGMTFPQIAELLGISEAAAWAGYRNADYKVLRAFRPLILQTLRIRALTEDDLDLGAPRNPRLQKKAVR